MQVHGDALAADDVRSLVADHLAQMHEVTPQTGSVHALDLGGLSGPDVRVWAARDDDGSLLGIVALKDLGGAHAELKSMRTVPAATGRGVATTLLEHVVDVARAEGTTRISLETGAEDFFAPARRLYLRHGFEPCAPFAAYVPDPLSVFLTREVRPAGR